MTIRHKLSGFKPQGQAWRQGFHLLGLGATVLLFLGQGTEALSQTPPAYHSSAIRQTMQSLKQSTRRWVEIDLSGQRLFAWEGDRQVYAIVVSTGKADSPTPVGTFAIQTQHRYARMQGEDYDVSDVPYTMYYSGNYAIHGAYWHHNFGTPVSHGCVNVAVDHARWLFYWAAIGTPVVVHE